MNKIIKSKIIELIATRDQRSISEVTEEINAFEEEALEDINFNGGQLFDWLCDLSCTFDIDMEIFEGIFCPDYE